MSARSLLYVPGDKPAMFPKALASGADAIILDLEDAVLHADKERARGIVVEWLRARPQTGVEIWVRVNGGDLMKEDLDAVVAHADGIYVPKVSSPEDVPEIGKPVTALVETSAGILGAREIAACGRVARLAIGEADLAGETGIRPSSDEREMLPMRMLVVLASAAAGIEPPVGPVSTDFKDLESMHRTSEDLARMGFGGRSAIHPAQVPSINAAFTPTEQEVAAARRLLDLFESAGGGVCVDDDGRMVDEPILKAARRLLGRAGR